MDIIMLEEGKIQVVCHNDIEETFWNNIKTVMAQSSTTIKALQKEIKKVREELSYKNMKEKHGKE